MTTRGRGSVRIGPISLFALVIILCLAVMAVLSVTTAQATYAAAERQASFTADTYANERAGQEFAADIDAALAPVRAAGGGLAEALAAVRAALPADAEHMVSAVTEEAKLFMPMAELIDLDKERARLEKELEKARKNYEGQMRKLSNENFVSRAPEAVVQTERERAEKAKALVENLEASLKNLG